MEPEGDSLEKNFELEDDVQSSESKLEKAGINWPVVRPTLMAILMVLVSVISSFIEMEDGRPTLISFARYGSIPIIAAIIGYGTNVIAIQMMFYPLEFIGFFPNAKIGCGLDLPLFGWQGVIPMKARDMAALTVDLMTTKLITVDEIFSRLEPSRVGEEVAELMPRVISEVISKAGRSALPKTWEHLPLSVRQQLVEQVTAEAPKIMEDFIGDLQKHIDACFDLKHCVVERLVSEKQVLNDIFLTCGDKEFDFIRVSGFYLGFFFGLFQMFVWIFVKSWWILPLCGVFVGWFTNVVALKVIFLPVEEKRVLGFKVQGLFLQRQDEVSVIYAKSVAELLLTAHILMTSLLEGPRRQAMLALVDKHVVESMEHQASYYKPAFLMTLGAEAWVDFRTAVCREFHGKLPLLFQTIEDYAQKALDLQDTLRSRLIKLSSSDFERLLHAVFEQDEIKLILVGAILGAIVGFLQALVQTPEQLGISF